ncbi:MAG: acyl carrier protein [Oscillospiraceae bacterium]|nr:acyl carrier protein [Oscillospiraceae bacterium]
MIFEKVCELIAEQFSMDVSSITMETSFEDDLGADSLDIVELSMALEEAFDIGQLRDEELSSLVTVGDLVRFLSSKVD